MFVDIALKLSGDITCQCTVLPFLISTFDNTSQYETILKNSGPFISDVLNEMLIQLQLNLKA